MHCISSGILNFATRYEVQSGPLPHPPFSIPGVTRCDLSRIADWAHLSWKWGKTYDLPQSPKGLPGTQREERFGKVELIVQSRVCLWCTETLLLKQCVGGKYNVTFLFLGKAARFTPETDICQSDMKCIFVRSMSSLRDFFIAFHHYYTYIYCVQYWTSVFTDPLFTGLNLQKLHFCIPWMMSPPSVGHLYMHCFAENADIGFLCHLKVIRVSQNRFLFLDKTVWWNIFSILVVITERRETSEQQKRLNS